MTQYNTLMVKLSNLQINKLKSGIKNNTEITLKISSNIVADSNNESNFPHNLGQSGGFLGRLLGSLLKIVLPLIGNVLKQLAKSGLIRLELTAAASAADATIHIKMFGSGRPWDLASRTTTLIISREEMNDIVK